MDYQGNIKAMARGPAPMTVQGWREPQNNCVSDRLVRAQGRLNAPNNCKDDERVHKVGEEFGSSALIVERIGGLGRVAGDFLSKASLELLRGVLMFVFCCPLSVCRQRERESPDLRGCPVPQPEGARHSQLRA